MNTRTICLTILIATIVHLASAESTTVELLRTPGGGIQPQAATDSTGNVHLIYFLGDPSGGDLYYVRRQRGTSDFSSPLRVNHRPRTAMAMGTIRGGQLAVGKNGRVHAVWDGMGDGVGAFSASAKKEHPLLYARLNEAGTAFESERNIITFAYGLDGGSSVAADSQGNVYVAWHAPTLGNTNGEASRAVFVSRSNDEGKTFQREAPAISESTGACACCGLRAFADNSGAVFILFRTATERVNRDEALLISLGVGEPFQISSRHPWKATTCPMSSASLSEANGRTLAGWETAGQVYFASVDPKTRQVSKPVCPAGGTGRKHPVVFGNDRGETLFAWTEGTSWGKGGSVAWQVYDREGTPSSQPGRAEGLPAWSLPTGFATSRGDFVIVY